MAHLGAHPGWHFGWHFGGFIPPVDPVSEQTLHIALDAGARVTYEWRTDIEPSFSGWEMRVSLLARPRQRYEFTALLTDAQQRALLATLAVSGVAAEPFSVGLAYEAIPVHSSTGELITLYDANQDWLVPAQSVLVVRGDGETAVATPQSLAGNTVGFDADISAVATPGSIMMPLVAVLLDETQVIERYKKNLSRWRIVGRAQRFRYGTAGSVGEGASVATYDSMPVWDRGVGVTSTAAQGIAMGTEMIDRGMGVALVGRFDAAKWLRPFEFGSSKRSEWQWLKKFLDTVRGMCVAFLLPTGRPDLVPVGDASTGVLTVSIDYETIWWPSLAHRRLRIVLDDGTAHYRTVESADEDELTLDSSLAGTIERIEFLETVRLDSDEVTVQWQDRRFSTSLVARVVQS